MDGAYTDPAVRQAISESISQAEADRMRGDKIREELYGVKYATPTPSITVGTQVRLTGVVIEADYGDRVLVAIDGGVSVVAQQDVSDLKLEVRRSSIEVIRQPFKRGEVVYHVGDKDSEPRTVVTDEAEGFVLLSRHVHGTETLEWDATTFERRP